VAEPVQRDQSGRWVGVLLIVLSASGFASLPVFGKLAYASGTEPIALLAWRFGIAAALMLMATVVVSWRKGRPLLPPVRVTLTMLMLGAVLLTPEVLLFFVGLQRVSAGYAETLLYVYPAWVVIIGAVAFRRRPSVITVACVIGAVAGAAITVGASYGGDTVGSIEVLGAAAIFAVYLVVASRLIPQAGSLPGTALVLTGAAVVFVVLAVVTDSRGPGDAGGWLGVLGMALLGTVVAFGLLSVGLGRVSPSTASVISTLEPLVAVALGVVVLGEGVGAQQVVGMAIILLSVGILLWGESRAADDGAAPLVNPFTAVE